MVLKVNSSKIDELIRSTRLLVSSQLLVADGQLVVSAIQFEFYSEKFKADVRNKVIFITML